MTDTNTEFATFGQKEITAYCHRWSVASGESIQFYVNCETETYRTDIVKLIQGDINPDGPEYRERPIDATVNGEYDGRPQHIHAGSHIEVPNASQLQLSDGFTVQSFVYPTTPGEGAQGLLTKWDDSTEQGYALVIDESGSLSLWLGSSDEVVRTSTDVAFESDTWYFVAASYDSNSGMIRLYQEPLQGIGRDLLPPSEDFSASTKSTVDIGPLAEPDAPFVMAGYAAPPGDGTEDTVVTGHFNGRLDRPRVCKEAVEEETLKSQSIETKVSDSVDALVASWDFSRGITEDGFDEPERVVDVGPYDLDGRAVNLPTRGVPGVTWTGGAADFTRAPDQFGAIHFHDDDLADANWDVDFEWDVPESIDSAVYAARLRTDDDEYYVPFVIRPSEKEPRSDIAVLLPTNTYLAYANTQHLAHTDSEPENAMGMMPVIDEDLYFLSSHPEYGLSLYDTHIDGHGSMFSTRLRPLINMSPKFIWGDTPPSHVQAFNQDLYLIDWLENHSYDYDVITDADLHREGLSLLESYNVVLTGSHPEYHTEEMLDALYGYQNDGGRLMYLGGNGFFYVTAFHPDTENIIEVRRPETDVIWPGDPAELYHAFTGEKGGWWAKRGRTPQQLTGVGFTSQWEPNGTYYRRLPDSYDPAVEFVFEDIDEETFGDFGLVGGGAAGQEIDRYDTELGSPSHAYTLATSEGHSEYAKRVIMESQSPKPYLDGRTSPYVRADMVYYRTPNDGAVFSTGSMAWVGSLSHDDYDNPVSQITKNVLDTFKRDEPTIEK